MSLSLASTFRTLPNLMAERPRQLFWSFLALHLVLWIILPTLSSPNAPLDVIEGYAWGHEWLLGTYKHPPMQAWVLEILATITGRANWAHFFASQLCVCVAFWAVWQTGRRILGEQQALIGVLLLEGVIYYNFTSTEFNPNVLQLAFWALAGWSFHCAVKDNRLIDWLLLGVWSAGGLYSKYSTVLLLGVFAFLVLERPEARRCLKKPGPYLALLTALLLFLPHILWLLQNDFQPFTYAKNRLQEAGPATHFVTPPAFFPTFLLSPIVFVVAQILAFLPASLLFLALDPAESSSESDRGISNFDQSFLAALSFVPMILTLLLAIVMGFKIHDMWGAPFFNFTGLWAVAKFYPKDVRARYRFIGAWIIIFFAPLLMFTTINALSPYVNTKPLRIHFPGKTIAEAIDHGWHDRYKAPLKYVIGNTWPAGNVAFYAPDRPHLFIDANISISPWIDLSDLRQYGGVIVWCKEHCNGGNKGHSINELKPEFLDKNFPKAEIQEPIVASRQTDADVFPVTIGWAIVPPATNLSP